MHKIVKILVAQLIATGCITALAATSLTDAEFKKGVKYDFALKDCKKLDGLVLTATAVEATWFEGKFHVFVSTNETPDGSGAGKYSKKPTQSQLDSLKGQKYCYVP